MDRLLPGQTLVANQELVSTNGWFAFRIAMDGTIGIRRVQSRIGIWHANTPPQPNGSLIMQSDGNLVAYSAQGSAYWASGTDRHPGAYLMLHDNGDLGVMDPANRRLWHSDSAQDLRSPTVRYQGQGGYAFNETSESWKEMCRSLPCFLALQWPGYSTTIVEDVIGGIPVVIQLWKGWCPKFLGFLGVTAFPGGVGGEVGIYRRIPGKVRPTSLPFLPAPFERIVMDGLASVADHDLWWPFPELGARIDFTLTNPVTREEFFSAGPETSYWLAKWMDDASYKAYAKAQGAPSTIFSPWYPENAGFPAKPDDFVLDFSINGKNYPTWADSTWAPDTSPTSLLLVG